VFQQTFDSVRYHETGLNPISSIRTAGDIRDLDAVIKWLKTKGFIGCEKLNMAYNLIN